MPYCQVRHANIYYEDLGEGIPILMIHGYGPDHRLMSGCMEPIFTKREGWRRIYLDLPGMGLTKEYREINSSDDMLNTLLDFIQVILPNQNYVLAGESYGGYLARGLIEKQPKQILGAACICPVIVPFLKDREVEPHTISRTDANFLETLTKEEEEDFRNNNIILNEYTWSRYNKEILSGCKIGDETFLNKIKNEYGFSFEIDQSVFSKPSLFLLGKQDSSVGYKDALALMNRYPRGTFAVLDTAGHNLQIEQPELFTTLVNEWVDRVKEILLLK